MKRAVLLLSLSCTCACHVTNQLYNPVPHSVVAVRPAAGRYDDPDPDCNPHVNACLAFLEFDEMGEAWDGRPDGQLDAALKLIERGHAGPNPPIIVTFVHGWKNNANDRPGSQNGNVLGFEGVLEFMKKHLYKDFPIVGIYVGWRGDLIPDYWPVRRQLSYFNREGAAIRIPGGSMTAAMTRIMMKAREDGNDAFVIMVGHSFGALVLERALAQAMTEYVLRRRDQPSAAVSDAVHSAWADLVVFVNSAAAANEGKQLLNLLKLMKYQPPASEAAESARPLLLSISSLGDAATRFALPVGHGLSFIGRKAQGGWRMYEHPEPPPVKSQSAFYLSTTAHMEALQSHLVVEVKDREVNRCTDPARPSVRFRDPFVLPNGVQYQICERPGRWNDTPYWAMQMPASIVRDHSGIFNENFVGLLQRFLPDAVQMREPRLRPMLQPRREE